MARRRRDIHVSPARRAWTTRGRVALLVLGAALLLALAGSGAASASNAFERRGMWIWELNNSSGGDPNAIIAKARANHIRTVYIKSGDHGHYWSQFSTSLVSRLKQAGLKVCGWQFVYGDDPKGEAAAAAKAVRNGADCFVIDAEGQYEGKYSPARTYMRRLRAAAGPNYPIGLAGFPYVDYHPAFPYSVFLGPGGAQYNLPQAYWKLIGASVDTAVRHTYVYNRPYGRPIHPLGQLFDHPPQSDVLRFRQLVAANGTAGLSWWVWQDAGSSDWSAASQSLSPFTERPTQAFAALTQGARGDLVVWAEQLLRSAGQSTDTQGTFGSTMLKALKKFQKKAGLHVTGRVGTDTWKALLQYFPSSSRSMRAARAGTGGGSDVPATAHMRAKRDEIPPPDKR